MPGRLQIATWAIFLLGVVRLAGLVLHEPMLGYANNYDFIRISSWFHLWPAPEPRPAGFDPLAQHLTAPIALYRHLPGLEGGLYYLTSDLVFVAVPWMLSGRGPVDLRLLGAARGLVLVLVAAAATRAYQRRSPRAGFVCALFFSVVLADPSFTLLFNTLYSEYSAVLWAYGAGGLVVYGLAFGGPGIGAACLLAGACLLLGLAKLQFAALPLLLVALLLLGSRWQVGWWCRWSLALCAACVALLVQVRAMGRGHYMWSARMAYATDTYLGTFLPQLRDPGRGVELLGLPRHCGHFVGKTWYEPGMQPPPCPEVFDVPRTRLVRLAVEEPSSVLAVLGRALPLWQDAILDHFGQVEGGDFARLDRRFPWGFWSLADLVSALPTRVFAALLLVGAVGGVTAPILLLRSREGAARLLPGFVLVLATVQGYALAVALLGDGFVDLARHSFLGQLCILPLTLATVALLAGFAGGGSVRWGRAK